MLYKNVDIDVRTLRAIVLDVLGRRESYCDKQYSGKNRLMRYMSWFNVSASEVELVNERLAELGYQSRVHSTHANRGANDYWGQSGFHYMRAKAILL